MYSTTTECSGVGLTLLRYKLFWLLVNHVGVQGTSHNRSDIGEEQFSSLPLSVRVRIYAAC